MAVAKRQGREKPTKIEHRNRSEEGQRKVSLSLSPPPPPRWGALLFASLDRRALTPRRWIFLLSSK